MRNGRGFWLSPHPSSLIPRQDTMVRCQTAVISFRYVRYSGGYVERFLSSSSGRLDFGVLSRQVVNGPFRRNGADVEKLVSSPSARQDVEALRWQVVKLRTL